jgi:hypothetical protein
VVPVWHYPRCPGKYGHKRYCPGRDLRASRRDFPDKVDSCKAVKRYIRRKEERATFCLSCHGNLAALKAFGVWHLRYSMIESLRRFFTYEYSFFNGQRNIELVINLHCVHSSTLRLEEIRLFLLAAWPSNVTLGYLQCSTHTHHNLSKSPLAEFLCSLKKKKGVNGRDLITFEVSCGQIRHP